MRRTETRGIVGVIDAGSTGIEALKPAVDLIAAGVRSGADARALATIALVVT